MEENFLKFRKLISEIGEFKNEEIVELLYNIRMLSISKSKKYIICRVMQKITADFSKQFSIETHDLGKKNKIMRFLFDVRGYQNVELYYKTYKYTYEDMNTLNLNRSARVAILVSPNDNSHNFVETVNINAGYNVRIFRKKNNAISWLEE